jgi:endoglucanase
MIAAAERRKHDAWLRELTGLPTAAGREDRVIAWVEDWVAARRNLRLRRDRAGNLVITRKPGNAKKPGAKKGSKRAARPLFFTAHLDHPAFVVRRLIDDRDVEMEFRGGVHPPYFDDASIELFDAKDRRHAATVLSLDAKAKPFKRVRARLARPATTLAPGDVGRWRFRGKLPRVTKGVLHAHACDDLAGVAAALAALDVVRRKRSAAHVGVFLTRAEEVGFVGTLAACESGTLPKRARLICLENSRSFVDSPIGGGPILRVGDRLSVFDPRLTNRIAALMTEFEKKQPGFRWQRKLMPGGACEATAFSEYGYETTCVCLPLGNYHNMTDIDAVLAGKRPARVGPEHIALDDYHDMVEMLIACANGLDAETGSDLKTRFGKLLARHQHVLEG